MKAIILYDSIGLAAKANAALQNASLRADAVAGWSVHPWRLDHLRIPCIAEEILSDAADAHLILFAFEYEKSPAAWLKNWLERWADHRQIKDAAVAEVSGGDANLLGNLASAEMSSFAERYGLSYIVDQSRGSETSNIVARALRDQASASVPPSTYFVDAPVRGWGINE